LLISVSTLPLGAFGQVPKLGGFGLIEEIVYGFEYGDIFSGNILNEFEEKEYVGGIFGGIKTKLNWSETLQSLSWFEVKGKIDQLVKQLNLSPELYLFEFNLDLVKDQIKTNKLSTYKEYSLYTKIVKDLSFIVEQTIAFEEIKKILLCNGTKFLTEKNLLDEYKEKSVPDNHISICLQLVFQSNEKTLQNKDVENIINELHTLLINCFNVKIRI
jgi:phenylalanyl-tRNA synthetase beta subunit